MYSDKNASTVEICAGVVRSRKDGQLEQLWHINHFRPTGAVEKTIEWRLVPQLEEQALAGQHSSR